MGLGYALTEDFPCDADGPADEHDAAGPRHHPGEGHAADRRDPGGGAAADAPYGIKGVGEIGLVPTAGAVAAALHDLDGEWRTTLPMRRRQRPADTDG